MNIVTLPPDPLPTVGPPIQPIFCLSEPLCSYRPDPLSDFRLTPGGWGRGYSTRAQVWV